MILWPPIDYYAVLWVAVTPPPLYDTHLIHTLCVVPLSLLVKGYPSLEVNVCTIPDLAVRLWSMVDLR